MPKCTRKIEIDAGHRVINHETKCRNVHGHRYVFEITVEGPELDRAGRVVDFGVIKGIIGAWLDEKMDHGYIHHPDDPVAPLLREQGFKTYQMPDEPTAENLAAHVGIIGEQLLHKAGHDALSVIAVRCRETPNCWADWSNY